MTIKKTAKAVTKILENQRGTFEGLQEASFMRSEKYLMDLLKEETKSSNYPIPPFVPLLLIWLFVMLFPLATFLDPAVITSPKINARGVVGFYVPLITTTLIFLINQKFLVPSCIFKKHYIPFVIHNALLVIGAIFVREVAFFLIERNPGEGITYFFTSYCFSNMKGGHFSFITVILFSILVGFVCGISVLYNIVLRHTLRAFLQREQKSMALQYELDFLKNQLSPHFLFNTLNNISALIQFDPKRAEESMAKLSKLLRVTLYQTSDRTIPIKEEIDILRKYADLEKLRLDSSYDLQFNVELEDENFQIAPLIAMPLVENTIKHSVNPNGKSFAHISIEQKGNTAIFRTENSNFPRKKKSNEGGLGLATFKKRLDLLYNGRYEYKTEVVGDVYKATLILVSDKTA
ncbi:sensor histidine kinase [Fibrobacter succinogenes]|uniref:sensor histidine kinase n=1 Tax=Fibrobacter succinogenes TaxID=833 RepID=UPI00156615A3|nr:histidine kinase [Fibrobacter succinogenes]